MTWEEWCAFNDARAKRLTEAKVAAARLVLLREEARREHASRVAREGPLYRLAEAEARVRKELADEHAKAPSPDDDGRP